MTTTANVTNVNNYIKQPLVGVVRQAVVLFSIISIKIKYIFKFFIKSNT